MMNLDSIQKDIAALPPDAQQVIFDLVDVLKKRYAEYSITKSGQSQENKQAEPEAITQKKPLAGSMKGTFVLPLADDFDAPLEDFEDYT